jgi:hypothetical protein
VREMELGCEMAMDRGEWVKPKKLWRGEII